MDYPSKNAKLHAAVAQTQHNTTSWVGHRNFDNKDIIAGQTFVAPTEADIEAIEIFPTVITRSGHVQITVFQFDDQQNQWGASIGSATVDISKENHEQWVPFHLNGLHLSKGKTYGFKLESNDTYVGLGEAAGSAMQPPYREGSEWKFINNEAKPRRYNYFSLAFKVDVKAA